MNFENLENLVIEWAKKKGIIPNANPETILLKLISEIGELSDNLIANKCLKDSVGDVLVCLINFSYSKKLKINECLKIAYEEIKNRDGVLLSNGNFLKG